MELSVEFLTEELKKKDIRPSYQRIKVLECLHQKESHPTVDEIFRRLAPEIPSLSKATIYNTLHLFVETGLVRIVSMDETENHYDIMLSNHGHFKCEACGAIFNFQVDIDKLPVNGLNQFEIKEKNVYFNGLCPDCILKKDKKE
jgi:Fe2+ or Zn2+ uptake regulation protein